MSIQPRSFATGASRDQDWGHLPPVFRPYWSDISKEWTWPTVVTDLLTATLPTPDLLYLLGMSTAQDTTPADTLAPLCGVWRTESVDTLRAQLAVYVDAHELAVKSAFTNHRTRPQIDVPQLAMVWSWRVVRAFNEHQRTEKTPMSWLVHVAVEAGLDWESAYQLVSVMMERKQSGGRLSPPEADLLAVAHRQGRPFDDEYQCLRAIIEALAHLYPGWRPPPKTAQYWREELHPSVRLPAEFRYYQTRHSTTPAGALQ